MKLYAQLSRRVSVEVHNLMINTGNSLVSKNKGHGGGSETCT